MGYTHYYQFHSVPTEKAFMRFSAGVLQLVKASNAKILGETLDDSFTFNGVGEEAHEDFSISRTDLHWGFCKTAGKPYDEVVTASLILARYLFDDFSLSSDGSWDEWQDGRDLFKRVIFLEPSEGTVFGKQDHLYPARSLA